MIAWDFDWKTGIDLSKLVNQQDPFSRKPSCHILPYCRSVDDGNGEVSIPEFQSVCHSLGLEISQAQAQALFRRFGYDSAMSYAKFSHTLLTQPSRQLAEDMPCKL